MRYSAQRECILKVLQSTKTHPTAEWIYEKAREAMPLLSLGTVYRNLKELSEAGTIITIETVDKKLRYDADTSEHMHFVCNCCGGVTDVYSEKISDKIDLGGKKVQSEKVVFYGLCDNCLKNEALQ